MSSRFGHRDTRSSLFDKYTGDRSSRTNSQSPARFGISQGAGAGAGAGAGPGAYSAGNNHGYKYSGTSSSAVVGAGGRGGEYRPATPNKKCVHSFSYVESSEVKRADGRRWGEQRRKSTKSGRVHADRVTEGARTYEA
ncbi:MAG: hypothetical protein LQ340_004728 [Diploschistes diacapsis]|nr:MAG: hypothetical protein LQ340_004728 [Diploschistes diacapsis]